MLTIERLMTEGLEVHLGLSHSDAIKRSIELLAEVGIPRPGAGSKTTRTSSAGVCASA